MASVASYNRLRHPPHPAQQQQCPLILSCDFQPPQVEHFFFVDAPRNYSSYPPLTANKVTKTIAPGFTIVRHPLLSECWITVGRV